MNYQALKWILESLLQTFKCPNCFSQVYDSDVDIVWTAWPYINIDIECSSCNKHSMVKAEVVSFDWPKINISKENLNNLKENLFNLKNLNINSISTIKDEEIVDLNRNLKKTAEVSDLFNEE